MTVDWSRRNTKSSPTQRPTILLSSLSANLRRSRRLVALRAHKMKFSGRENARLITHDGANWKVLQFFAPVQKTQLDQERNLQNFRAYLFDQRGGGAGSSASGQQIVNQQNPAPRL